MKASDVQRAVVANMDKYRKLRFGDFSQVLPGIR
jgi:hypothetical protein